MKQFKTKCTICGEDNHMTNLPGRRSPKCRKCGAILPHFLNGEFVEGHKVEENEKQT
jgi:hypothetical protein